MQAGDRVYVRQLDELDRRQSGSIGGKAAGLIGLREMSLPVPDGFVILTDAYRRFVRSSGLRTEIDRLLDALDGDPPPETLQEKTDRLRGKIELAPVPAGVAREIEQAYEQLGCTAVAVRSSAQGEDSPEVSFAGQHDSFLNVQGAGEVLRAVRCCWASLWSFRALSYRRQSELVSDDAAGAVVVQTMVDADRAGVMFTADPVSGRRDRVVINASWGLGESVVSGSVTPDQWTVDADTGEVLQSTIEEKQSMVVPAEGGTQQQKTPAKLRSRPALSPKEVQKLARLGVQIQKHLGRPQDVEWALADGEFCFLQSRPVTGLYPLPAADVQRPLGVHYCLSYGAQGIRGPMTPMGINLFGLMYESVRPLYDAMMRMEVPDLQNVGGRLYWDMTGMLQDEQMRNMVDFIAVVDPEGSAVLRQLRQQRSDALPTGDEQAGFAIPPGRILLRLIGTGVPLAVRTLYALACPRRAVSSVLSAADRAIQDMQRRSVKLQGVQQRLQFVEQQPAEAVDVLLRQASTLYVGLGALFACRHKLKDWFDDETLIEPVLRWLPNNPTTEMGVSLRKAAAESVDADGRVDPEAPAFREFLRTYGHRAVTEIDVGVPRWREDPSQPVDMGESLLLSEQDSEMRRQRAHLEARRQMDEIVSRTRQQRGALSAGFMAFLLRRVRQLAGMRERPKFDMVRILDICRRVLKEAGEDLCRQGYLDDPEDVFFLTLQDLKEPTGDDLRHIVQRNRQSYRREMRRKRVPLVITDRGEAFYSADRGGGGLVGTPVAPGVYEGPVRVVDDPRGVRLQEGEVLVAPATDPAWTPLFLNAGALVMEVGGVMSHGSGVAREYGIPAVAGLPGITQKLRDGQKVRVNGNKGEIALLQD